MTLPTPPAPLPPDPIHPAVVTAPWTDAQVENLNFYQRARLFHPFTCGRRDEHRDNPGILVAERDGWRCPADGCDYRQKWALPFMTATPTFGMRAQVRARERLRVIVRGPRPCLLHEDIHPAHGLDCMQAYIDWKRAHSHLGHAAPDAYALEVEQRILARLVREHAPARTRHLNPALTK